MTLQKDYTSRNAAETKKDTDPKTGGGNDSQSGGNNSKNASTSGR